MTGVNRLDAAEAMGLVHDDQACAVITAELVACTLGQRRHCDRLELRVDLAGKVARALASVRRAFMVGRA